MDYPNILKYLGENWLTRQMAFIESKQWIEEVARDKMSLAPAMHLLAKIDELISKLERVEGFDKWAKEASTSKSFEDCFFEIMIFENLYRKADSFEIKPNSSINDKVPEASITKGNELFYIEAKKLEKIPPSVVNKVNTLLARTRKKFAPRKGILFIGCFDFFHYEGDKPKAKKEFQELKAEVERKLRNHRENSRILAVMLTNIYIQTDMEKSSFQKIYYLVPRPENLGGFNESKFREIFDVDGFIEDENTTP